MAGSIFIKRLESIKKMNGTLKRFRNEANQFIFRIDERIHHALEGVNRIVFQKREKLNQCRDVISSASMALSRCEHLRMTNPLHDCNMQRHEVDRLNREKNNVERGLQEAERLYQMLNERVNQYQHNTAIFKSNTLAEMEKATKFLLDLSVHIEDYIALQMDDGNKLPNTSEHSMIAISLEKPLDQAIVPDKGAMQLLHEKKFLTNDK